MTPLKDLTVIAPEPAVFTAKLSPGDPRANITWYKGSREVYSDNRVTISFEGDTAKLEIKQSQPNDEDEYKMVASNKVSEFTTKATLTVHSKYMANSQSL